MSPRKIVREISKRAGVAPQSVSVRGSGHLRLQYAAGTVTVSCTPSCRHAVNQAARDVLRVIGGQS